jgi:hypothetical protein
MNIILYILGSVITSIAAIIILSHWYAKSIEVENGSDLYALGGIILALGLFLIIVGGNL